MLGSRSIGALKTSKFSSFIKKNLFEFAVFFNAFQPVNEMSEYYFGQCKENSNLLYSGNALLAGMHTYLSLYIDTLKTCEDNGRGLSRREPKENPLFLKHNLYSVPNTPKEETRKT